MQDKTVAIKPVRLFQNSLTKDTFRLTLNVSDVSLGGRGVRLDLEGCVLLLDKDSAAKTHQIKEGQAVSGLAELASSGLAFDFTGRIALIESIQYGDDEGVLLYLSFAPHFQLPQKVIPIAMAGAV